MLEFLRTYRQALSHEHGWEVPIACPVCAAHVMPVFNDWTPSQSIQWGDRPTIYANLNCPKCSAPVKSAAESKLRELFADVEIPRSNRRILRWYVAYAIASSLLLVTFGLAFFGGQISRAMFAAAVVPVALLRSLGSWLNYAVACHRKRCDCGRPAYKFMGLLGKTYCYRCSSCGRLLRLRD